MKNCWPTCMHPRDNKDGKKKRKNTQVGLLHCRVLLIHLLAYWAVDRWLTLAPLLPAPSLPFIPRHVPLPLLLPSHAPLAPFSTICCCYPPPKNQITIKTPNPKGCHFLKIHLWRDLAADVYLYEAPPLCYTLYKYMPLYLFTQGRGGGGEDVNQWEVRGVLVHMRGRKYQHDWLYLQSINSIKTPEKTTFKVWCL